MTKLNGEVNIYTIDDVEYVKLEEYLGLKDMIIHNLVNYIEGQRIRQVKGFADETFNKMLDWSKNTVKIFGSKLVFEKAKESNG